MSKWAGIIAFRDEVEKEPSVWVEDVVEKKYYGDIVKNYNYYDNSSEINDSININNRISIISDPYARDNFHKILYVTYMGTRWKVKNVEVQYPRLLLGIGGVYNGKN